MKRALLLSTLTGLALAALAQPRRAQTAPYAEPLDRIQDDWINRNPIPTRPMAVAPDGSLWVVNSYLGELVQVLDYADADFVPAPTIGKRFRTPPGPVSVATYLPASGSYRLLVVCQHVNAVAVYDSASGKMLALLGVRAGPADVVVDGQKHAWVSCPPADAVVEIDLNVAAFTQRVYAIPAKSPSFLALYQGKVLVAPRISGNGSLAARKPVTLENRETLEVNEHAGPQGILDTLDEVNVVHPGEGLPDQDLFWLDNSGVTPAVWPVARSTGTLLFAHALQPGTSSLWQLNLEADNKHPDRQTEASIRGRFVENRLTKVGLPAALAQDDDPPQPALEFLKLNDTILGTPEVDFPADREHALGTPYSLAFTADGQSCFVAGLQTDNVVRLDASGARVPGAVFALPPGTMPRQVLVDPADTVLAVWGSGQLVAGDDTVGDCKVHLFHLAPPQDSRQVSIGVDPTPKTIRLGRQLFFDASHSLHNDSSCASCHDEGKTDMLAWNLSNLEARGPGSADDDGFDDKGPMVTQTLVGIATALPFHWRGEQQRGLRDFNRGVADFHAAFLDLLGDPALPPGLDEAPGGPFDQFEAFVLSLTEDANQFQHPDRVLSDAILPPDMDGNPIPSSAIDGQTRFGNGVDGIGCTRCHMLPKGTSNEVVNNAFSGERLEKRLWLKIAPFQGLQFKATPVSVDVGFRAPPSPDPAQPNPYPRIGTGLGHAGVVPHLRPILLTMVPGTQGDADQFKRDDVVSFLHQFDTGIAPAAHAAQLLNSSNYLTLPLWISTYLLDQEAKRNCDVAIVGKLAPGNASVPYAAWAYDRSQLKFRGESKNAVPRNLNYFKNQAQLGGFFAVFGLPPGTARRFALDFDGDQLLNGDEPQGSKDGRFYVDTDGDLFWDGVEALAAPTPSDPDDVSSTPAQDTGIPQILTTPLEFQWVTQRVGRLTFETSELTDATLTLTPTTPGPQIVVQSEAKMVHNIVVDELLHSREYEGVLVVSDLMLPPNVLPPLAFETIQTALPNQNGVNTDSVIVVDLDLPAPTYVATAPSHWAFTATGRVVERSGSGTGVGGVDVVARVLVKKATDDFSVGRPALAADFRLPNGGANDQNPLTNPLVTPFVAGATELYTRLAPPFAVARTDAAGAFAISFELLEGPIASTDEITLSLEAMGRHVVNVNLDGVPGQETPVFEGQDVGDEFWADDGTPEYVPGFWSFPDTSSLDRKVTVTIP